MIIVYAMDPTTEKYPRLEGMFIRPENAIKLAKKLELQNKDNKIVFSKIPCDFEDLLDNLPSILSKVNKIL